MDTMRMQRIFLAPNGHRFALATALAVAAAVFPPRLLAQTAAQVVAELPAAVRTAIDKAATEVLEGTGAPSASIAVIRDGRIAYLQAHGKARIEPAVPATTGMRYSIGSISKQFTAAAILLGLGTNYGLGVQVSATGGRRQVSHTGKVSGFTAANVIYPDDRAAVVVLTNLDATGASSQLASRIANALFRATGGEADTEQALATARKVFEGLQHGRIERGLFTANANAYFAEAALADFAAGLGPLGTPLEFEQATQSLRGGMTARSYRIRFASRTLRLTTFVMPTAGWSSIRSLRQNRWEGKEQRAKGRGQRAEGRGQRA